MIAKLSKYKDISQASIFLSGSKSESNRLLILQALYPDIEIENIASCDDTTVLQKALASQDDTIDIHHAGTAMRFLTAYLAATTQKEITLTGSPSMRQRPIGPLVATLRDMGAAITYTGKQGYPPLKIAPATLSGNATIDAGMSSQYISALALIGPYLKKGLTLTLTGNITSKPYIDMTLSLLSGIGVESTFKGQDIRILPLKKSNKVKIAVEGDWSSASYFYSLVALSKKRCVHLSSFKTNSLQADAALATLYESLGVTTTAIDSQTIALSKNDAPLPAGFKADLTPSPDLAQTIAVTCFGLGIACHLTGLHTLKIKETDRLVALQNELTKLGAVVHITQDTLLLESHEIAFENRTQDIEIATYDDHRMAMAFGVLAELFCVTIQDPMVVTKSYPAYYSDLKKMGISADFC
ncbi:3-phosphoshikimate 1-carboxyvinyltransferase [Flavobacteriaceae bacterium]|nr:3-phosphoshikimate 1-carboxyvinyltransferase [Flavobacteriaceae bacterium]